MKNSTIVEMVCKQYHWDKRDVNVEFISKYPSRTDTDAVVYEFKVNYNPEYAKVTPVEFTIKIESDYL